MSREIYIRRSERDPVIERIPWDPNQGITKNAWEQESRIIKATEELHFLYDTEEDATELQDYIYEKLHLSSNFWDVCQKEYPQFLEKFGTPIGIELSILYFAIKRSWSGDYDNDDTEIPMKARKDVGIFGNLLDSQYWRDNLIRIDEDILRDTLHDLPLLPELCRDVYAFFLFQFSRHTLDLYQPGIDNKHEKKRIKAWISYLDNLISAADRFVSTANVKPQPIDSQASALLPNGTKTTDVARCLDTLFETNDDIHDHYLRQASLEKAAARIFKINKEQIHARWEEAKKEGTTEPKRINMIKLLPIIQAALVEDIRAANGIGTG